MVVCYALSGDQPDSPVHDDAVQDRTHDDVQRNPIQSQRGATITTGRDPNKRHASVGIRRLDRKSPTNTSINDGKTSQYPKNKYAMESAVDSSLLYAKTNSAEKVKLKETVKIAETSAIPA